MLLGDAAAVPALASRALAAGPAWALGAQTQEASGAWSAPHTHTNTQSRPRALVQPEAEAASTPDQDTLGG